MTEHQSSEEGAEGLRLTEAEEFALCEAMEAWTDRPDTSDNEGPYAVVERILADRLAAVQAEAEIAGQMKHITAEMVRGNQPLEAKEEMIADLRARLSHVEAERDGWQARAATNREGWAQMLARAESAEAERDDLRARLLAVETQVAEWERDDEESLNRFGQHLMGGSVLSCAEHLRAVLASPSTHTQRDTEAQRDARLDNLIEREERAAEGCLDCKAGEPHMCPDAQRDTETAAQALREAADAMDICAKPGSLGWSDWLRARADSLATGAGS
jgi:hypothetical protein